MPRDHLLAPGPGHVQLARHRVPPQRAHRGDGAAGVPPDLPAARLGGARRRGDLGHAARHRARGAGARRPAGGRHRRHRHHQPARDHGAVEPPQRPAHPPRHRLAGPPHRAAVRAAARARGHGRPGAAQHRAGDRPLLQRHQDPLAAGPRERRAHRRRAWRPGLRHHRQLAAVEADRRPRACHRREQRGAHDAVRHPPQRVGPRAAEGAARARQPAAARVPQQPRVRRDRPPSGSARRSPSPASPATSRPRCSARPASRPGWRRTPTAPAASC